jgi:membrane protease YdiL (CAAX protease family)
MNAQRAGGQDRQRAEQSGPAPWLYLFGVLAWTWTFHGIVALTGQSLFQFPTVILALLGALGPSIVAGLLVVRGRWDPALDPTVGAFFRRAFDPRALPWRWYLWIVGLVLVLAAGPVLLDPATLRERGLIEPGAGVTLFIGFLFGALEEPGWRGYAQEGLQRRMPVVVASLVIGVFWAAWHLPLFIIAGTYQAGLGVGTPAFWAFHLGIVAGSPVYAWLYNAAGRITLAAVLYHALSNVVRELVADPSDVAEVGVEAALALFVTLAAWRWMRRPEHPSPRGGEAR